MFTDSSTIFIRQILRKWLMQSLNAISVENAFAVGCSVTFALPVRLVARLIRTPP